MWCLIWAGQCKMVEYWNKYSKPWSIHPSQASHCLSVPRKSQAIFLKCSSTLNAASALFQLPLFHFTVRCHKVPDIISLTKLPTVIKDHMIPFLFVVFHYYNQRKVSWIIPSVPPLIGEVEAMLVSCASQITLSISSLGPQCWWKGSIAWYPGNYHAYPGLAMSLVSVRACVVCVYVSV